MNRELATCGLLALMVTPGGNLEGIAIADPQSDLVYLGDEHPDSVHEFDLSTGTLRAMDAGRR